MESTAAPDGDLYPELNEEYILPKRTSVVAVPTSTMEEEHDVTDSSPICQNKILTDSHEDIQFEAATANKNGTVASAAECEHDNTNATDKQPGDKSSDGDESQQQNFGEIIKESIVETVSA